MTDRGGRHGYHKNVQNASYALVNFYGFFLRVFLRDHLSGRLLKRKTREKGILTESGLRRGGSY